MDKSDLSKFQLNRNSPRPQPKRRRWWIAGALLAMIAVGLVARPTPQPVTTTTVGLAYPSQAFVQLNATGYVVASRRAAVASKGSGRLEWLGVEEGSRVKAGDVIARLENKDMQAGVAQAEAGVRAANAKLDQAIADFTDARAALTRAEDLLAKKFIAQSAFDTAVARHDIAKAAVGAARAQVGVAQAQLRAQQVALEYTLIRAPFDGVVLTKQANVGDVITPFNVSVEAKGAVVTMADMSTLEVEADVSESNLHTVAVDQPCEIQLDAIPKVRLRGTVARIVPTVDRTKATILVKIRFTDHDPRVLPDMSAKVAFLSRAIAPENNQPVTALLKKAIVRRDGKDVIFVVENQRVKQITVTTGQDIGDMIEIRQGLKGGETVVIDPSEKLHDGSRVELATKKS